MKDKIFIFITVVLIILFAVTILENFFLSLPSQKAPRSHLVEENRGGDSSTLKKGLEQSGLVPQEAKYYRVIE